MSTPNKVSCIYHADCLDGFTAAWVVSHHYQNKLRAVPAVYNVPLDTSDFDGDTVYIVDFSLPGAELDALCAKAARVTVLDHHQSAVDRLNEYYSKHPRPDNLALILDTSKSGCRLTWEYFYPDAKRIPGLIYFVEDRDLWKFQFNHTKAICAALYASEMTFDNWTQLYRNLEHLAGIENVARAGNELLAKEQLDVQWHLEHATQICSVFGYRVPVINAPKYLTSVIGDRAAQSAPFAVLYYIRSDGQYQVSLRARAGTVDVRKLAERLGGGGHPSAAGFVVSPEVWHLTILAE